MSDIRDELLKGLAMVEEAYEIAEKRFQADSLPIRMTLGITEKQMEAMLQLFTLHLELLQVKHVRSNIREKMELLNAVLNMGLGGPEPDFSGGPIA